MLRRMLALGEDARQRDLVALRIVFVGGSQLGGELAATSRAAFGPVVYNLYGSTEVAYATIATPEDLRRRARQRRLAAARRGRAALRRPTASEVPRRRPAGSSSATASRSRATPAAAPRRSSTA